jgi:hypothetical protein
MRMQLQTDDSTLMAGEYLPNGKGLLILPDPQRKVIGAGHDLAFLSKYKIIDRHHMPLQFAIGCELPLNPLEAFH